MSIIADTTEVVAIDKLKPYDKNPRIGDIGAIAESLETNSQYRPIVVQKSSNKILAGNHTWQAAKHLGWKEIAVTFVDVNDEQAKRIVLADNRTNDLASYDSKVLTELLESLPDPVGTGYTSAEVDALLDSIEERMSSGETVDDVIPAHVIKTMTEDEAEVSGLEEEATSGGSVGGVNRPDFQGDDDVRQVEAQEDVSVNQLMEMRALFETWEGEIWPTESRWGIPMLRRDMLVEDLPDKIDTWVGAIHHTREEIDDAERWWFYNYGVGIREVPFARSIMAFHVYDEKFENWWHLPAYYVSKFMAAGVTQSITPDFSMWTEWPEALNIYNLYRNYWLGRFFQECGWRVIPNIAAGGPNSLNYAWDGCPERPPVASIQLQTIPKANEPEWKPTIDSFKRALETVKPESLIIYTGKRGPEFMEEVFKVSKVQPELVVVDSFAKKKTDMGVFERERPTGTKRSMTGQKPGENENEDD